MGTKLTFGNPEFEELERLGLSLFKGEASGVEVVSAGFNCVRVGEPWVPPAVTPLPTTHMSSPARHTARVHTTRGITARCGCPDCACVLVAGGLGERLGYSGIKVALPTEITTGTTYLGLYCKEILALQAASNAVAGGTTRTVPLAIMTSDDTHGRTVATLEAESYFGMADGQVTLRAACAAGATRD